ncbi:oxidoreductase [Paenibacillus pinihumi]|uniref:oxidoreductase n=1 Tax=Paenibacillus pinihumi TaxID=669462 RepID=UPI0004170562|nr:oxidoreductase [Paenibacillus pinihumi]
MLEKVVFITGASSGMGETTALRLKKAGYTVYAGARRVERMNNLQQQGIHTLRLDVTDDSSMTQAIEQIIKEQGRIDILINNAGYGSYGALEDVPISEAKYQFEVNVFGLAKLTQLVLPYMRKEKYGKIVNISSIGGKIYEPLGAWYHATKFAVEGLSDCLRLEVKGFGIDVIVIEPGGIKTEWSGIAGENLLKTSGSTAYGQLARQMANMFRNSTSGSEPDVIAKIIEKSIQARKPKTRYAAGFGSKPFLFLRKILSDKAYDRLWMFILRSTAKNN